MKKAKLGLRYKCNKKKVTQNENSFTMVFADNPKGGNEMSHYHHLTIGEREILYLMHGQGKNQSEIARELGRSRSTISRELRRNRKKREAYSPSRAERYYRKRRKNCGRKHILRCPEKREIIRRYIQELHWSPEQIEKRFRLEQHPLKISYASIYRAIHAGVFGRESRVGRKQRFSYHLRRKGKWPRKHGGTTRQGQYQKEYTIHDRPASANKRQEIGHFEGDTMIGKRGGACLVTLVDRRSRFTLAAKSPNLSAPAVRDTMVQLLRQVPAQRVKSVTPDRGPEFAQYQEISALLHHIPFYFADAYSPWQRGTNENTNGLLREFFPKGTDFSSVSQDDISSFVHCLNLRPRKCLAWLSPFEVFFDCLLHLS